MGDWSIGSPAPSGASALSVATSFAGSDLLTFLDISDTGTPPANAAGSNKAITFADVLAGITDPVKVTLSSTRALTISVDGTDTYYGAFIVDAVNGFFGTYNWATDLYYGVGAALPLPAGYVGLGAFYSGAGIQGSTNGTGNPIFCVLTSTQTNAGFATGQSALGINDNNEIFTWGSTLDDGSGNMTVGAAQTVTGVTHLNGGSDTSGTAAATNPSFTTATAKQLSTTQDVELYICVNTTGTYTIAVGPTSSPANTLVNNKSLTAGQVVNAKIPKSWYAEITGTIANLTIIQVTS